MDSTDSPSCRSSPLAPPRSVITLVDDGPYLLGHDRGDRPALDRLERRELTIRAMPAPDDPPCRDLAWLSPPRASLFDFAGGHVTLDGLEVVLDPAEGDDSLVAVRAEDTELTIRRCVFRRPAEPSGRGEGSGPRVEGDRAVVHAGAKAPGTDYCP